MSNKDKYTEIEKLEYMKQLALDDTMALVELAASCDIKDGDERYEKLSIYKGATSTLGIYSKIVGLLGKSKVVVDVIAEDTKDAEVNQQLIKDAEDLYNSMRLGVKV